MPNDGRRQAKTINKLFVLHAAMIDHRLTAGTDATVLAILVELQNPARGYSWPSVETIAHVAGLKERAIRSSIRRLEAAGYIQITNGGGRHKSNQYRVRLHAFVEPPLRERIARALERRYDRAGFSENNLGGIASETLHGGAETRHEDDTKPGTTVPPIPSYEDQLTNNPSACAASNCGSTHDRDDEERERAVFLRKVEWSLKVAQREGKAFSGENVTALYRSLCDVSEDCGGYMNGDPIAGWAHRLSEELLFLMDEETLAKAVA